MQKVLALTVDGRMTYCTCPPDQRGRGKCNHISHQNPGESVEDFINRVSVKVDRSGAIDTLPQTQEVSQEDVDTMAAQLDAIAGCHVTAENIREVLQRLTPEQVDEISRIGFEAAPIFSLPIRQEEYEQEVAETKLYFANLHKWGVSGSQSAVDQMFGEIGMTPVHGGQFVNIHGNYAKGVTEDEHFDKSYYSREAMIVKGVGTAKPGYAIWENQEVVVVRNGKYDRVLWSDLTLGDSFETEGAHSVVTDLTDWDFKPCYVVKAEEFVEVVVSDDHMMQLKVLDGKGECVNGRLQHSARHRAVIGCPDDYTWVSAYDVYRSSVEGHKVLTLGGLPVDVGIFQDGIPQRVRCISTTMGYYTINGITHHNTARKMFYAVSDTLVMHDCGGPYIDAMHCKLPNGHVCERCARLTVGGEKVREGDLLGGDVSTALSEGLTQASMELKHPIYVHQMVEVLRERTVGFREPVMIEWKDVHVGDCFADGAVVTAVSEMQMKPCYEMVSEHGDHLIASYDHLLKAMVFDQDGVMVNERLNRSLQEREAYGLEGELSDILWVCVEDLFHALEQDEAVELLQADGSTVGLRSVETYADAQWQEVLCVTTDRGEYAIGCFLSHNTGSMGSLNKQHVADTIMATLDGWGTSPVIEKMKEAKTTMERRQILVDGLTELYKQANIKQDPFNIQMIAKKMTSYVRVPGEGLRPVEDGECCSIVSCLTAGSSNNIFNEVELGSGYRKLTRPMEQTIGPDAANQILN